ncbi:MAG: glycosyltransferase family 39 protein [Chloroflexota bacterium]
MTAHNDQARLSSGTYWTALTLAALTVITRWPLRTQFLYNWDAANFALGVRHYDVTLHQPHPPGYPYFVALGSLFTLFSGDPNAGLQAAAVLLECVAVAALLLLGTRMFSFRAGLAAALLLLGSVTFWTYGEVALAYPALAAFSTLTALFAFETIFQKRNRAVACALAYTLGTGFRPDLALFLLPLLLACCYRRPRGTVMITLAVGFGGVAAWLAPAALLSGGLDKYWAVFTAYASVDVIERYVPTSTGLAGLAVNLRDTAQYTFYALYAEALVVGAGALLWLRPRPTTQEWRVLLFLGGWVAPMAAFYTLAHVGDPGYVFSVLPSVLLLGVGGVWRWLRTRDEYIHGLAACALTLVLLANTLIFFVHDRPLTLPGLRASDRAAGARLNYLRSFGPDEVMVLSYDSFKLFRFYLPDQPHSVWLDTSTLRRQVIPVPSGVRWVVLTDPSVFGLSMGLRAEAIFLPGNAWAAQLPVQPGQSLVYENRRLRLEG